jgi:regulator of protease activity HflC (stomatin/prohibitin superfamily)
MSDQISGGTITAIFLSLIFVIALGMWGCPQYSVYQQTLEGKAALERATQEKKIAIEQAIAERESAKEKAEAIRIMGEAAKKYPEYRAQEFIASFADAIKGGDVRMIFVPTEANIPLLPILDTTRVAP